MELLEKRVSSNSLFPTTQQSHVSTAGRESPEWEELGKPQISSPLVERPWSGRSCAILRSPAH